MNFDKIIANARALDQKIKAMEDEHKKQLEPFKAMKVKLNAIVLDALNKQGTQNVSTPAGGAHKHSRVSYSLSEPEDFKRHVIGSEAWDLLDWKVNATAATDFLAENQLLPPGVKRSEMVDVRFTAPTKAVKTTAAKAAKPASAAASEAIFPEFADADPAEA